MSQRLSCADSRCENGWVTPLPNYVDQYAPWPADPPDGASAELLAAHAELVEKVRVQRASHSNDVYPCKTCRPSQFHRWAQGHYKVGHDPSRCGQCQDVHRGRSPDIDAIKSYVPDDDADWTKTRADIGGGG